MNQVAIRQEHPKKLMLLDYMADKYALTPDQFRATVRATCGLSTATPEQVAAFLIVAKEYDLNPLLKEIYAFPGKGGGVVPIVSIDGWVNLVNSNKHCDGFEFEMEHDDEGKLVACTCKMYRKDRSHPVTVTEYLSECKRSTEPWKMEHRMLRHKAMIQAARYAFGFAGIYDEDEGRTIAEAVDVTPKAPVRVPSPSEVEGKVINHKDGDPSNNDISNLEMVKKDDPITTGPQPKQWMLPSISNNYDGWIEGAFTQIAAMQDGGELSTFWEQMIEPHHGTGELFPSDYDDLLAAHDKRQEQLNSDE